MKWLITSRPEDHLDDALNEQMLVKVDVQGQGDAVKAYINEKLSTFHSKRGYDNELLANMSCEINKRANNIFLWVALVFQELAKADYWDAMDIICSTPPGLDNLYNNLMKKIETKHGSSEKYCKNVLAATLLALRPLTLDELGVCAGLHKRVPAIGISEKCGSFLAIRDGTVYLIHQSAREYLEANYTARLQQDGLARGHTEIGQRLVQAMSNSLTKNMYNIQPGTLLKDIKPPQPDKLAPIRYSCEFWVDHLCASSSQTMQQGQSLLTDNGHVFSFLQTHLLHWLEGMILLDNFSAGVRSIQKLLSTVLVCPKS